jgi:hypothetical protein
LQVVPEEHEPLPAGQQSLTQSPVPTSCPVMTQVTHVLSVRSQMTSGASDVQFESLVHSTHTFGVGTVSHAGVDPVQRDVVQSTV